MSVDPLGLYGLDFHYYVVYYMGWRALGRTNASTAQEIAFASQYVDDFRETAPIGVDAIFAVIGKQGQDREFQHRLRDFHFYDPLGWPVRRADRSNAMAWHLTREAIASGNPRRMGIALHGVADTFSHEEFTWQPGDFNFRSGFLSWIVPPIGHVQAGHAPDQPFQDPHKAADAAIHIYRLLRKFGEQSGLSLPDAIDEEQLRIELEAFFTTYVGNTDDRVRMWQALLTWEGVPLIEYDPKRPPGGLRRVYSQQFGEDAREHRRAVSEFLNEN